MLPVGYVLNSVTCAHMGQCRAQGDRMPPASGRLLHDSMRSDMSTATVIAVISVLIAGTSFAVNFWIGHRSAVRARKPVLVFLDDPERGCWVLQNLGNGPALNVLVAQRQS